MLSTHKPEDEVFQKGYVPPPRKNKLSEIESIELPVDFLNGLPQSRSKVKRRRLDIVGEGLSKQKVVRLKQVVK